MDIVSLFLFHCYWLYFHCIFFCIIIILNIQKCTHRFDYYSFNVLSINYITQLSIKYEYYNILSPQFNKKIGEEEAVVAVAASAGGSDSDEIPSMFEEKFEDWMAIPGNEAKYEASCENFDEAAYELQLSKLA